MNRPSHRPPNPRPQRRPSDVLREEHRFAEHTRGRLRRERWLRLHVFLIAGTMLLALLAGGAALRALGAESLAWRYGLLLPLAYLVYLGLLRLWAAWLLRHQQAPDPLDGLDLLDALPSGGGGSPSFGSGGGGDFGGGGASGDFAEGAVNVGAEAIGSLDEGAVVVVPLAIVVGLVALLAGILGLGVFALFGVEVLLAVAVEVALAAVAGGLAFRREREGWLLRALGHTWTAAIGVLLLGVLLGWAIDRWLPAADSLLQALRMLRG